MELLGTRFIELGFSILPYSFFAFLPYRWLEHIWSLGYSRLVKGLWYLALGFTYLVGGIGVDVIVMYICFIEACDLFFQQLEVNRMRNKGKS